MKQFKREKKDSIDFLLTINKDSHFLNKLFNTIFLYDIGFFRLRDW